MRKALIATALLCACTAPPQRTPPPAPNGTVQALRPGHWRGVVKSTLVDFYIAQVSPGSVAVRLNGGVLTPLKDSPEHPVSFVDRPRNCARNADGYSFRCTRYQGMHIDNGFLCCSYRFGAETLHVCFAPVG